MSEPFLLQTDAGVVLNAVVISASFDSAPVGMTRISGVSLSVVFTGAGTGTFKLQASNDPGPPGATSWLDVPNSTADPAAGSPILWNVSNAQWRWTRAVWTAAVGSLTMTVRGNLQDDELT